MSSVKLHFSFTKNFQKKKYCENFSISRENFCFLVTVHEWKMKKEIEIDKIKQTLCEKLGNLFQKNLTLKLISNNYCFQEKYFWSIIHLHGNSQNHVEKFSHRTKENPLWSRDKMLSGKYSPSGIFRNSHEWISRFQFFFKSAWKRQKKNYQERHCDRVDVMLLCYIFDNFFVSFNKIETNNNIFPLDSNKTTCMYNIRILIKTHFFLFKQWFDISFVSWTRRVVTYVRIIKLYLTLRRIRKIWILYEEKFLKFSSFFNSLYVKNQVLKLICSKGFGWDLIRILFLIILIF